MWLWIFTLVSVAVAQDDASSLAWSCVGEAAGSAIPLGQGQPAALAWSRGTVVAISAVPNVYGMSGLRSGGIGGMHGAEGAGFGSALTVLEAGTTRRLMMRLNAGVVLTDAVSVGLGVQLSRWSFARYGAVHEAGLTIGAQVRSEHLTTGIALYATAQEFRPLTADGLRLAVGSAIRLSEEIMVIAEAVDARALELRMGVQAKIIDELAVIFSWSDGTEVVGAGLDMRSADWRAVAGGRWHPILGWSYGIDLLLAWR